MRRILFCALLGSLTCVSFAGERVALADWHLDGVRKSSRDALTVEGDGKKISVWHSDAVSLERNAVYAFTFASATSNLNGTVVCAPDYANADIAFKASTGSATHTIFFRTPNDARAERTSLRVGLWEANGFVSFSNPSLEKVRLTDSRIGRVTLGAGETVEGRTYSFEANYHSPLGGVSRVMTGYDGAFYNTFRYCLNTGNSVTYRHELPDRTWLSMRLSYDCWYLAKGRGAVEVSTDGVAWRRLTTIEKGGRGAVDVPQDLFPAIALYVRFVAAENEANPEEGSYLQICDYACTGEFRGAPLFAVGSTACEAPSVCVPSQPEPFGARIELAKGTPFAAWSASSGEKVTRTQPLPAKTRRGLALRAAANEAEAVQLVVRPSRELEGVRVSCGALRTAKGEALPADAITVASVDYVRVLQPSDDSSRRGLHPDPLLPQTDAGVSCPADANQPFWIRVTVPKGQAPGVYRGALSLQADGCEPVSVPFVVEVFAFALPDTLTCQTVIGCDFAPTVAYQKLKTKEEKQIVADRFAKMWAAYHLSPYDPDPLTAWSVSWPGLEELRAKNALTVEAARKLEPVFDWSARDAGLTRAFETFHFNTFHVRVEGINHGYETDDMDLRGVKSSDPVYAVLLEKYLGAIDRHLVEKGWADKAYAYWVDEPAEEHYPKVMEGMARLRKYAPHLRRLLTEEPVEALVGGPNLWVPLSPRLHAPGEKTVRAAGDTMWWYICCAPKAPYAGMFIEHPAVELRTWLWQTWAENLTGILIWEGAYWTSPTAYPHTGPDQDPYRDTMSWDRNGNDPPGTKRPFGNGDGRLFYPSPAAVNTTDACLDGPIPTQRVEMLRDGLEDYEYFVLLRRLLDEKGASLKPTERAELTDLLTVPSDVSRSLTEFSRKPQALESHRLKLARAIERLTTNRNAKRR